VIAERQDAERRFDAALHDKKLPDHEGRVHGMRQGVLARMKRRTGH
jgi:hypothetical protein